MFPYAEIIRCDRAIADADARLASLAAQVGDASILFPGKGERTVRSMRATLDAIREVYAAGKADRVFDETLPDLIVRNANELAAEFYDRAVKTPDTVGDKAGEIADAVADAAPKIGAFLTLALIVTGLVALAYLSRNVRAVAA